MADTGDSRIAFLRERTEAAEGSATFAVPFRQERVDLRKIQVPIEFPLYRIESGRTHRAQSQYIEEHGLEDDFFEDPEAEEVQQAQQEILLAMVNEKGLRQNLLDNPQQNPIVLTYDGFIVDGNRRTAALRDDGNVEHLTAVVLDRTAEASDVYETELEFQMAEETKADYNWIDELLHIRFGVESLYESRPPDDVIHAIAQRMNRGDEGVREGLGKLKLVDLYLNWLGRPGKYHRVGMTGTGSASQAFDDLYARVKQQQFRNLSELHQRAIREACFTVIEHGGYEDVRRVADMVRTRPAEVVDGLRDELPDELAARLDQVPDAEEKGGSEGTSGVLDELADAEETHGQPQAAELLNVTGAPNADQVGPAVIDVAEDLYEREREAKDQLEPLRKVKRAANTLESVRLSANTPRLGEIADELGRVAAETDRLSEELDEHGSGD